MASNWPFPKQAAYAEDQAHARTFLTFHVTHRLMQTGALVSVPISAAASAFSAYRAQLPFRTAILAAFRPRSIGVGALVGLALGVPASLGRMRGREEVEWQDRTWRLLGNRGQMEVEMWSLAGLVVGVVLAARRGGGVLPVLGTAAAGDLMGVHGYLVWRYGVKGGNGTDPE